MKQTKFSVSGSGNSEASISALRKMRCFLLTGKSDAPDDKKSQDFLQKIKEDAGFHVLWFYLKV